MGPRTRERRQTIGLRGWWLASSCLLCGAAVGSPFLEPGDASLRSDLQLLVDELPLAATPIVWPLPWSSVLADLDAASSATPSPAVADALARINTLARAATTGGPLLRMRLGYTDDPPRFRSFESTLREEGEVAFGIEWTGDRFTANINVARVLDAADDSYRADGSYVGMILGDWAFGLGSQERWWGPGWSGSQILSTNARPTPQLSVRRMAARPFEPNWLRWLGPWSLEAFVGHLDDERDVPDALLFGFRFMVKPLPRLEVAVSRTAQFCGDGRPCDLSSFVDMLLGRDNQGVNVGVEEEPGNQLGGFDVRWAMPQRPFALYAQWIGEDTRQGGPQIGSWLRLAGGEHWGALRGWRYRVHAELLDTICREGGMGFGGRKYNCGYEHGIYTSGYRYEGRSIGHGSDNDSTIKAIGATFTGAAEQSFTVALLAGEINEGPLSSQPHGLSQVPVELFELTLSHRRRLLLGELFVHVRAEQIDDETAGTTTRDASVGVEWRLGY